MSSERKRVEELMEGSYGLIVKQDIASTVKRDIFLLAERLYMGSGDPDEISLTTFLVKVKEVVAVADIARCAAAARVWDGRFTDGGEA
jgi:hypothetical protein